MLNECVQALRFANVKLETEVASTQKALAQSKIDCAEKTSKIQALEIAKCWLETGLASAQKGLEESKVECCVVGSLYVYIFQIK